MHDKLSDPRHAISIVDEIMPIYSTARQRLLFGPSMLVTAFAINQYANILCKLKELTLCKVSSFRAISRLKSDALPQQYTLLAARHP